MSQQENQHQKQGEEEDEEEADYQRKEASRQLSVILIKRGVNCRLITSAGFFIPTILRLGMNNKNLNIYWRSKPEKIGCDLTMVTDIVKGFVLGKGSTSSAFCNVKSEKCIGILFPDFVIQLETVDEETCAALHLCLQTLLSEVTAIDENDQFLYRLKYLGCQVSIQQEKQLQLKVHASYKQGAFAIYNYCEKSYFYQISRAFKSWVAVVKDSNSDNMNVDKHRWRLHAIANMEIDLQAWYHSVFYDEVYRVRGPFWFREAALAVYRRSYDLVHNALTPLEENALAHVLCSTETTYGDVAGQMFTVQEIVNNDQFALFQTLASKGITVTKYPRMGRPGRKVFRLSFVEGYIYLTWKGRFGNQGIELNKVSAVKSGICTDITKKQGKQEKANQYLSVISVGRSLDLFFDSVDERQQWHDLLSILVDKECGTKQDLIYCHGEDLSDFDRQVIYSAIGKYPGPSATNYSTSNWDTLPEDD